MLSNKEMIPILQADEASHMIKNKAESFGYIVERKGNSLTIRSL